MDPILSGYSQIFVALAGALAASTAVAAVLYPLREMLRQAQARRRHPQGKSIRPSPLPYSEQVHALTRKLSTLTVEADNVLSKMSQVVQEQEARRAHLLEEVSHLTQQETELKARLEQMSKEDIVGQLIAQERRHQEERKEDARHDYRLFLLGVVASAVLTLIAALIAVATHHLGMT